MARASEDCWGEVLPAVDHVEIARGYKLQGWVGAKDYYNPNPTSWPTTSREWWIYFAQGSDGGPIKIGRTTNPIARISELGCGYPFGTLRFVGLWVGIRGDEARLHAMFAHFRLSGEWFKPAREIIEFIQRGEP